MITYQYYVSIQAHKHRFPADDLQASSSPKGQPYATRYPRDHTLMDSSLNM
jgi:hypothetical protein